jgi:hypothetical protein
MGPADADRSRAGPDRDRHRRRLDIGKYKLLFPTSDAMAAWARLVAYFLKALGLLIVFLQATWFKKD